MTSELRAAAFALRSARAIRERCGDVLEAGLRGTLTHFTISEDALGPLAEFTAQVTRSRYPDLRIPPHGRLAHFDAGGVARAAELKRALAGLPPLERARALCDVIVTSVLVDAGAGAQWCFEERPNLRIGRSEGLAVASLAWLAAGGLNRLRRPYEVDAAALLAVGEADFERAFQVSEANPLVGVAGRLHVLRALGQAILDRVDLFPIPRPGAIIDTLVAASRDGELAAEQLLRTVLEALGSIWPGRIDLQGIPLGDVWRHPAALGSGPTRGLVPFHKLSQWLCYSLFPALEAAQVRVVALEGLTGLAEYRNGGLFLDGGVLRLRDPAAAFQLHDVSAELIVEWRALTIALLDRLAPLVRSELGLDEQTLPLAGLLEGGSWAAGRELARRVRPDGSPPLRVASDGTVF